MDIRFKFDTITDNDDYNLEDINEINNYVIKILSDSQIESATYKFIASLPGDCIWNLNNYRALRLYFLEKGCGKKQREYAKNYNHYLENYSRVLSNRYNIKSEYLKDVSFCIINHFVLKKGAEKWLSVCVSGKINDESIEEYLQRCFIDDMISLDDHEAQALFMFYICNHLSQNNELPVYRLLPRYIDIKHLTDLLEEYTKNKSATVLENSLFGDDITDNIQKTKLTIDDIDLMSGTEFEDLITKLFNNMGYTAYTTKATGDQGIDVIAEKNGFKYGIQAKCYSGTVGNAAVQEATAGKQYYGCDKVIVVTNNCFTKSAIKLAQANGVILWDRFILSEKIIYLN